jgi:peptidylprolyl isomerase
MKRIALLFAIAAAVSAAQTPAPKPATTVAKPAVKKPVTPATSAIKLPPGVKPVKGVLKTAFTLKYQDFVIGTGAVAEPGKLYKVHYTGWLASDGTKFDSSYDHRMPVMDKDNKPVSDPDGKPKLGDPQPLSFPQGRGRLIPGWDQGFEGMRIGGKRRLFIPYQLAYGVPGRPPKIPAKSDLIFDVELIDVTDVPAQPNMPPGARMMPQRPGGEPGSTPRVGSVPGPPTIPPAGANPSAVPPRADAPANPATPPPTATPAPTTPPQTPAPDTKPANPAQPH